MAIFYNISKNVIPLKYHMFISLPLWSCFGGSVELTVKHGELNELLSFSPGATVPSVNPTFFS